MGVIKALARTGLARDVVEVAVQEGTPVMVDEALTQRVLLTRNLAKVGVAQEETATASQAKMVAMSDLGERVRQGPHPALMAVHSA